MRYCWIFFTVLMSCFALPCWADNPTETPFDHKIQVADMVFQWSVKNDKLTISLAAETEGWVAVGFNPSEAMKDANFILGYVKNGTVTMADHFGVTHHQHKSDEKLGGKNNITDVSGNEKKGVTTIVFTIPLKSGDENDPEISPDGETTVLLAYSSGRDSFRTRHKFRTTLKVNLSTGNYSEME